MLGSFWLCLFISIKEYVKKKFEIVSISLFQCACYLGTLQFYKATCSQSCSMCWLFDYFLRFVKNFLCCFFQKQATKDHSTQGILLKTTLLNEKQSNLDKEMYGNIFFITKMRKYLQSDWLRGVQYWPYFFSICIFLLNKKKKNQHSICIVQK